ncbi:4094_t:CDS:2 [Ambispora gerdemannii]|uniref:4094_t:CDS:1 n=1 Tax=Ambispora gerdemannii TaxID=144530 RepID=A0A9N9A7Y3_9GLOM|nr:4094_t:CDS:2 [Ambispora gerdemannii]
MACAQPSDTAGLLIICYVLHEIIENLATDKSSLYATLLVSRDWCRTTVPILWRNPFELLPTTWDQDLVKIRSLLRVYFAYVTGDDMAAVKTWNVRIPKLRSSPTFDYIAFLQNLNDRHVITAVNILFPYLTEGFAYPIGHNRVCYALIKEMIRRASNLAEVTISAQHWAILPNEHIEGFFAMLGEQHPKIRKLRFRLRNFGSYLYADDQLKYAVCASTLIHQLKYLEEVEFANIDVGLTEILETLKTRPTSLIKIKFRYCCFYDGRHAILRDWESLEGLEEFLSVGCHHLASSDLRFLEEKMIVKDKMGLRVQLIGKDKNNENQLESKDSK